MLALLALIVGLHHVGAAVSDIPSDTNYIIRHNASCVASGFFFERETIPNSLDIKCHLCFCQNNNTAVCWRRENKRCDMKHYRDFGQRNSRARRSPLNFGQIFVRDAAREFFNKQSPEECKPFESSFSDGCPPADWCIGCTVCDCDAGGHWDCHVLSFCTDKKGKKVVKKHKAHHRNRNSKRQSKTSTKVATTKLTTRSPQKPTKKRSVNPRTRRDQVKQSSVVNKHKMKQLKATNVNKFTTIKKPLPKFQAKKPATSKHKVTRRPVYIKKNVSTVKPLNIKSAGDKSVKNNTVEVAQKVVKQFMSTMQKMMKNIDLKTNKTIQQANKTLSKRSMPKQNVKKFSTEANQKSKFIKKQVSNRNIPKPHNANTNKYKRAKRHVTVAEPASQTSNSNQSDTWNAYNKTDDNGNTTMIPDITISELTVINLNNSDILSNDTSKIILMKNAMNRDIYITDNHIHIENQHSTVHDGTLYQNVNNTYSTIPSINDNHSLRQNQSNKLEDITFLTTDRSYTSSNFKQHNSNYRTVSKEKLPKEIKSSENIIYEQYLNVSTQTENHRCPFRTLLQKLIGTETGQYNQTTEKSAVLKKPKRYTILTKIKRLFKKIFNKRNRNKFRHTDDLYYSNFKFKQSEFKKPGNLKLQSNEKENLRQRMFALKRESENVLKTIGIIKGLLHILELNTNETQYNISSDLYAPNENFNKLNIIVKNNFYQDERDRKLTEDQRTQVNYIKDNVQEFIKSIGKFATILDDVIRIAMSHSRREHKIDKIKVNKSNELNIIINDYNDTMYNKVEKLKKLLFNYNILQNKFINQIYVILNNFDPKITGDNNLNTKERREYYNKLNKTDAIETNSANIIKNIRKLKQLSEKFYVQRRRKRETVDDEDALEYLLILMEYLLKRHSPVNPTVNDGLDLLIEAIKTAPDIILVRKKVLDNVAENVLVEKSTTPTILLKKYSNYSKTMEEQNKYSPTAYNKKIKIGDQSDDNEDDEEENIEEIYRSFKSHKNFSSEQKQEGMLSGGSNISKTSESYDNLQDKGATHMSRKKENNTLARKEIQGSLEDEVATTTSNPVAVEMDTTSISIVTDGSNIVNEGLKSQFKDTSNINTLLVDSKANIDWIAENFKEVKQFRQIETKFSTTPKNLSPTRTHKHIENMSDITSEKKTYNRHKVDTTSTEEIMSKKQLDLLNSLDYVEDEVDSKDDKFSSDTYV